MVQGIWDSSSRLLTQACARLDVLDRTQVVAMFDVLKERVCENLKDKLSFWEQLPFRLLGVLICFLDGSKAESKLIAAWCIESYDSMLDKNLAHRVTRRFLAVAGESFRQALMSYAENAKGLWEYPELLRELVSYGVILLTERRLEGEHFRIKRAGEEAHSVTIEPPAICAAMRRKDSLELIDRHDFRDFVEAYWNARSGPMSKWSVKNLLSHKFTCNRLLEMSSTEFNSRTLWLVVFNDFVPFSIQEQRMPLGDNCLLAM